MFCYYVIFDKNSSFNQKLQKSYFKQIIPNLTPTLLIEDTAKIYNLDLTSNYQIVFLYIKHTSKFEKFLDKEKVIYDVLEVIKKSEDSFWFNFWIYLCLCLGILGIIYYKLI
jgi:type IV secretory pathway TrbF-like protein